LNKDELSDLEEEGLIKRFEYTYELAWTTLQDLLRERGYSDISGPRPDGKIWLRVIKSRNLTAHVYDEETVDEIAQVIRRIITMSLKISKKILLQLKVEKTFVNQNYSSLYSGLDESELYELVKVLSSNLKVNEIVLFGSRAKGNFHPFSDIDIALKGEGIILTDLLDLSNDLDLLWLPYKVDLVNFAKIKEKDLIDHVNCVGVRLYKKN
jgi:nucleotidyltransferase substrate binding protein (TIGR01987 family)